MGREDSRKVKKFAFILVKQDRIPNLSLVFDNELSFRVTFWSVGEGSASKEAI